VTRFPAFVARSSANSGDQLDRSRSAGIGHARQRVASAVTGFGGGAGFPGAGAEF